MEYRILGKSGLHVSVISFGAGPISGLMVGEDEATQRLALRRAVESGVNWIDTAATYGDGQSERSLGAASRACPDSGDVSIATKVRLAPDQLENIPAAIRASFEGSLKRLGTDRVTLLQLHNSITRRRGDLPTSLSINDVLGPQRKAVTNECRGRLVKEYARADAYMAHGWHGGPTDVLLRTHQWVRSAIRGIAQRNKIMRRSPMCGDSSIPRDSL